MELRRLRGAKITDKASLDATLDWRSSENEQATSRHPPNSMRICSLLTDFGLRDYYVAAIKGTLLRLAPRATLVDLSHEIEPGDIHGAGFTLRAAAPTFPHGTVHLAVVDPGVGSNRRILAVCTSGQIFVAPDNGLLGSLLEVAQVVTVERPDLYLAGPGETFQGRDRFAPVAAFLLRGGRLGDLGPACTDPVRVASEEAFRDGGLLCGCVVHIDRFGNLITNIPTEWLAGSFLRATIGALEIDRVVPFYADLEVGEVAVIPGSTGTLELAQRDGSLAIQASLQLGAQVRIETARREQLAVPKPTSDRP